MINDTEGKETEELEEILNEKEAKTRAILLEMVKDNSHYSLIQPNNVVRWFSFIYLVSAVGRRSP